MNSQSRANLEELFYRRLAQTSDKPYGICVERAEGSYLWDENGKKFLDLVAGISVGLIGHRHPAVLKAISTQLERYLHTMVYGEYIQDVQVELADNLSMSLPENLNCTYLVNSGTEANEAALKLAKRHSGRSKFVSFHQSYHGSTHGSLSVSGNEQKKYSFRPLLPDVRFIHLNEEKDLEVIDTKTAAVILEPVQGDAGVRVAGKEYMKALRKRCDETSTLLIFDEIQCGLGRTGAMFAFEHWGVVPDILTLAKGLGGGLPIGCLISDFEIMMDFRNHPPLGHITTFGGNPLSCAASIAVLNVLRKDGLIKSASEKGKLFKKLLNHREIKEIRQIGLMLAVDLESEIKLEKLIEYCKAGGVIIYRFLSHPSGFRISPALNISDEDIRQSADVILQSLDALSQ